MADFANISLEVGGGVARICLRRPQALNAFTRAMGLEILDALELCADDEDIRVVVFTGSGRAFSAGADIRVERPRTLEGNLDLSASLQQIYNPIILVIKRMPKPVIAAVNGPAVGLGCSLACACDFVLAAESAYFLLAFVRIGLVPDGGVSVTLPARVGVGRAMQLAMLGERLSAQDAKAWGLVDEVCQDDNFEERVSDFAARLANGPTATYASIKQLFNRAHLVDLEAQLGVEAAAQYQRGLADEHAEGVRAFIEKREPDFRRGRGTSR